MVFVHETNKSQTTKTIPDLIEELILKLKISDRTNNNKPILDSEFVYEIL